ncbi:peptidoglycan amidohydrolase family protein, partial [uncultured Anaerococcus sp.]|uniref:peptidoglycan amidohydrolase family protein n=1 Tax=uncultured Anaerococcus sp. TaxID=293428 RepID=UPI00288A3B70
MKKINKTVLLASTLFITSAINLTDNSYANEDNKSLVKESVDRLSEDEKVKVDTTENLNKEEISTDADAELDSTNQEEENTDKDKSENTDDKELLDENKDEQESSKSTEPSEENEEETDKRIPGLIYYNDKSLDDVLNESKDSSSHEDPVFNESNEIKEENYYSNNDGGYFVEKNNEIKYYKGNKLVKNTCIKINDSIFRADKKGVITNPKNTWLNIGGDIYYNNNNGDIAKGISQIGKDKYYFSNDGVLQIDKKLITQGYYYEVNGMGKMNVVPNQWVSVNANVYRTLKDGKIAKGITKIGSQDFYFDKDGKLQTNKKMIVSDKYYEVNYLGVITNPKNKWLAIDGVTYRTLSDGKIARGLAQINGNTYVFDYKTGAMIVGRPSITNGLYFDINNKGVAKLIKNQWVTYQGKTFHTNNSGYIQKGAWEINGNTYYFDDNGLVLNTTYMKNGVKYKINEKGIVKVDGYKVAGERNIDKTMEWMFTAKNNGMTYDMGPARTSEKSADCSSAVFRSLIYGGFLDSNAYVGNTETLFSMGAKGEIMYEISPGEIDYGDIFVSGIPGKSLGEGGHTGFILNKNQDTIIHMNYSDDGVSITPRVGRMGDRSGRPVKYFRLRNAKSNRVYVDKK